MDITQIALNLLHICHTKVRVLNQAYSTMVDISIPLAVRLCCCYRYLKLSSWIITHSASYLGHNGSEQEYLPFYNYNVEVCNHYCNQGKSNAHTWSSYGVYMCCSSWRGQSYVVSEDSGKMLKPTLCLKPKCTAHSCQPSRKHSRSEM